MTAKTATPKERRTRGPRTPSEQAADAAQRTATLFEKLPSGSYSADSALKPIAVLLRWDNTGGVPPEEAARALRAVVEHWGYLTKYVTVERLEAQSDRLQGSVEELQNVELEELRKVVKRLGRRADDEPLEETRPRLTLVDGGRVD